MVCGIRFMLDTFNFGTHLINFMLCVFSFMACAKSISRSCHLILPVCSTYMLCVSNFRAYIVYSIHVYFICSM